MSRPPRKLRGPELKEDMTTRIYRCISTNLVLAVAVAGVTPTVAWAQTSDSNSNLPNSPSSSSALHMAAELRSIRQTMSAAVPASASQPAAQSDDGTSGSQKPVGTAAAEVPPPGGVAVSNSAGAAIAPAKQRRVRTLVIEVAAVVGAAVAVGTVVALSKASPSRPPGSH